MARFRGIPLGANRAEFEAYERRVEDAALDMHLSELEDAEAEDEDEARCAWEGWE